MLKRFSGEVGEGWIGPPWWREARICRPDLRYKFSRKIERETRCEIHAMRNIPMEEGHVKAGHCNPGRLIHSHRYFDKDIASYPCRSSSSKRQFTSANYLVIGASLTEPRGGGGGGKLILLFTSQNPKYSVAYAWILLLFIRYRRSYVCIDIRLPPSRIFLITTSPKKFTWVQVQYFSIGHTRDLSLAA